MFVCCLFDQNTVNIMKYYYYLKQLFFYYNIF